MFYFAGQNQQTHSQILQHLFPDAMRYAAVPLKYLGNQESKDTLKLILPGHLSRSFLPQTQLCLFLLCLPFFCHSCRELRQAVTRLGSSFLPFWVGAVQKKKSRDVVMASQPSSSPCGFLPGDVLMTLLLPSKHLSIAIDQGQHSFLRMNVHRQSR